MVFDKNYTKNFVKMINLLYKVNMARVLCEALCKKLNQKKQAV